jgi:hypothetical protein
MYKDTLKELTDYELSLLQHSAKKEARDSDFIKVIDEIMRGRFIERHKKQGKEIRQELKRMESNPLDK